MTTGDIKQCEIETHHAQAEGRTSCWCGFKKYPQVDAEKPHGHAKVSRKTGGAYADMEDVVASELARINSAAAQGNVAIVPGHRAGCFCQGEDRDLRCDPNAQPLPAVLGNEAKGEPPWKCPRCKWEGATPDASPQNPVERGANRALCPACPNCGRYFLGDEFPPPDQHVAPQPIWISGEGDGDPNYYIEGEQPENGIELLAATPIRRSLGKVHDCRPRA